MGNKYQDRIEAKNKVYSEKGGPCPYPEGSRLSRFYNKFLIHYWNMEFVADEMAEAYGEYRPDKLEVLQTDKG